MTIINYVLRFLFFVAHSLCLSCQLFLWLRGGILRTVLVLVSLKFIVLQEQRKDQTPSPKITFTGKKVFLFEACYFDLSVFIQSHDLAMLYWILYKQFQCGAPLYLLFSVWMSPSPGSPDCAA